MKKKVIIKEKGQKDKVLEIIQRDENHVRICEQYPARIWKNKKKVLPRKQKYKTFEE